MKESVLFKSVGCMLIDFRCPLLFFVEAGWGCRETYIILFFGLISLLNNVHHFL